jgi:tetratricopeptide (TPR) repeat protein
VPVDVFSEAAALTFLAARTGQADVAGAQAVAAELGLLPLALAQAAAVIAGQHLSYGTYLDRLRRLPIDDLLVAEEAGQYPRGAAAAVLVSLENVRIGERGEACEAVMDLLAVLSPSGVRRSLIHAAAESSRPGREGPLPALTPEAADRVLARLAGVSLLTFSVDGSAVTAHRLVMRVIRENLAASGSLKAVCGAAEQLLYAQIPSSRRNWHQDRPAARDLVEQIMALDESAARFPTDGDLDRRLMRLRRWAMFFLNSLGDSAALAIVIGERLLINHEQSLGPDHPGTLTSRNHLASAYLAAGRINEAITSHQETLADRERILGFDHPSTLTSRNNLAAAYRAAGREDEAITLLQQNLADRERILGADHPATLASRNNLATSYRATGRTDEATALLQQNLASCERTLGPDHPNTLLSRRNFAQACRDAGRMDEARELER